VDVRVRVCVGVGVRVGVGVGLGVGVGVGGGGGGGVGVRAWAWAWAWAWAHAHTLQSICHHAAYTSLQVQVAQPPRFSERWKPTGPSCAVSTATIRTSHCSRVTTSSFNFLESPFSWVA